MKLERPDEKGWHLCYGILGGPRQELLQRYLADILSLKETQLTWAHPKETHLFWMELTLNGNLPGQKNGCCHDWHIFYCGSFRDVTLILPLLLCESLTWISYFCTFFCCVLILELIGSEARTAWQLWIIAPCLHYKGKGLWTPDETVGDPILKPWALIWIHSPQSHSSWKAFYKMLECVCGKLCPFSQKEHLWDQVLMLDEKTRITCWALDWEPKKDVAYNW